MSRDLHTESRKRFPFPDHPSKDNYSPEEYLAIEEAYFAARSKAEDARNQWVEKEQVAEALKRVEAEKVKKRREQEERRHASAQKTARGAAQVLAAEPRACARCVCSLRE